jgi:hypothetical protein
MDPLVRDSDLLEDREHVLHESGLRLLALLAGGKPFPFADPRATREYLHRFRIGDVLCDKSRLMRPAR